MFPTSQAMMTLILFSLSFLIRIALISKGPYNVDCLGLAIASEETLRTGQLHYLYGTGYPLTVILGAIFIVILKIFSLPDPVYAVNLMSVVTGSLCTPVFYLFIKNLLDEKTAFFSAVMLSVFPIFLGLSVYGMSHAPGMLFLFLGLLFLIYFLKKNQRRDLLLSAFFFGCMGAARVHELAMMLVPIGYFFLWGNRFLPGKQKPQWTSDDFALFMAVIGLTTIAFHLPYLIQPSRQVYLSQLQMYSQAGLWENFLGFFSPAFEKSLTQITFGLTPVGTGIALLGLARLMPRNFPLFVFLVFWGLIPLSFYGNLQMTTSRFLMIAIMPLIIAQGYFFAYLLQIKNFLFKLTTAAVFCFLIIFVLAGMYPILQFRHQNALIVDMARYVGRHTEPHARIITTDEGLFIHYYGHRQLLNRPTENISPLSLEMQEFKARIDQLLDQDIPVYITLSGLFAYDLNKDFSRFMQTQYHLEYRGEHLSEGWHQGETRQRTGVEKLFRVLNSAGAH